MQIKVTNLISDPSTGLVLKVLWSAFDERDGEEVSISNSTELSPKSPSAGDFIQYENITESVAEAWLLSALGQEELDEIRAIVEKKLSRKINPTQVKGLPW